MTVKDKDAVNIEPGKPAAFHGELSIKAVDKLPESAKRDDSVMDGNQVIIGHSESGHHHVATGGTYYRDENNPLLAYLVTDREVQVRHNKPDESTRHRTFNLLTNGNATVVWRIGNAREKRGLDGWQKSID